MQAYVGVLLQERSQVVGTTVTGTPGDETGEPVVLILVQIPRTNLFQEVELRMVGSLRLIRTLQKRGRHASCPLLCTGQHGGNDHGRKAGEALAPSTKLVGASLSTQ